MDASIFRAYDIRGIAGKQLTEAVITDIGKAIGTRALMAGQAKIIIGRDGRLSGPLLLKALCTGLLSTGIDVIDIGMVPTPVVYFGTHWFKTGTCVMLTGSHNPADYNGLKIMIGGETLSGEAIQAIYRCAQKKVFTEGAGVYQAIDISHFYCEEILSKITIKKRLKIVVDAGSGVAGDLGPLLLTAVGCEVIPLYCEIDGNFPYHHPDPGQPKNLVDLITAVQYHQADIGLAFDGDGDRLGVVTNKGDIIWPDKILMLFAQAVLLENNNKNNNIIFDVKCSKNVGKIIQAAGGTPLMSATGHSLIKAKMRETGALLAGEMSGHFFFKDKWYGFDDGLYAAARLLEMLSGFSGDMASLINTLPDSVSTPEINITVGDKEKFEIIEQLRVSNAFQASNQSVNIITIDGLRVEFPHGWGLVRASNTTPCLVLRFEADSRAELERIQQEFKYQLGRCGACFDVCS